MDIAIPYMASDIMRGELGEGEGERGLSGKSDIEEKLYEFTLEGRWEEVVKIYKEHADAGVHSTSITSTKDTALHVAVKDGQEDRVVELVGAIVKHGDIKSLEIKNEGGDTPLHCAASWGSLKMCKCINDETDLIKVRNEKGETPLYLAARHGHKDAFLYLHSVCADKSLEPCRRSDGDTILHSTIRRDYFDLAFQIIDLYEDLAGSVDEKGISPLHILADKPSAFPSSSNFRWWNKLAYHCIIVEPLKVDERNWTKEFVPHHVNDISVRRNEQTLPKTYDKCLNFIEFINTITQIVFWLVCLGGNRKPAADTEDPRYDGNGHVTKKYWTCYKLFISAYDHVISLALAIFGSKDLRKKKQKHVWSGQVLEALWKRSSKAYVRGGSKPEVPPIDEFDKDIFSIYEVFKEKPKQVTENDSERRETALMVAARNGVLEIVKKILDEKPGTIHEINSQEQNILHVAVEHRQPHVFELLRKHRLWKNLIRGVDKDENTVLHLAAKLSKYKPWHIPGAAMQMQWEIKWFLYIRELMPAYVLFQGNSKNETPAEIFVKDHEELVKEGAEWLKSTSESCSVVAALIAGVAFATSSSIPGGTQEETGKPYLEQQPAFNLFALSSLLALCFSTTALVMFLAILTSRQQPRDFRRDLPLKLLLGLSSLFFSIASMLGSFSASFFFVVKDKLHQVVLPLYAATCIPITFYAIAQFPLYADLLRAIFRKAPQSSNRESEKLIL